MRRTAPLQLAAAMFVAAGGFVHAREWLNSYRDVPAGAPGAALVRIGFPLNAGLSLLVAAALVVTAFAYRRWAPAVVVGAIAFQAVGLATLIGSRVGTVLGWSEPIWTLGADQTRAVEIGALVVLAGLVAVWFRDRAPRLRPATVRRDA
ncbi:MAG TPA: hypothetical protein VM264_08970 [Acidimicrobiales bacterium]|nr:hypothetical protein [Acidimicrobiales bacterium]